MLDPQVALVTEECLSGSGAPIATQATFNSAFQPIFSLRHSLVIGNEALLRARRSDGHQVPPLQVFSGHSRGRRIELDRQCHQTHLRNAREILGCGQKLFLNVRSETLLDERYIDELIGAVSEAGLHPNQVVIEIFEGEGSIDQLAVAVDLYRKKGFVIALDDFGVGFSNIDRILRLKPDIVKFDRSLIFLASQDIAAKRVFVGLINVLHDTGIGVVVEGIETQLELDLASAAGADMVQGYFLGRPASCQEPPQEHVGMLSASSA